MRHTKDFEQKYKTRSAGGTGLCAMAKLRGLSVLLGVELGGFAGVVVSLMLMTLSSVRMVRSFLMVAFLLGHGRLISASGDPTHYAPARVVSRFVWTYGSGRHEARS